MRERRPLGLNVAANTVTAASVIATALISIPLILDEVGLAGYGVWTLAQTMLLWATTAEAGFGPAVQRFVAVRYGAGATDDVHRLLWSTIVSYTSVGGLMAVVGYLASPALVELFDVPADLHDDAVAMFRVASGAIWLAVLAAGFGNVQQGLEHFAALAISATVGSLGFLFGVIGFLAAGLGLVGLAYAAVIQQAAMLVARLVDLRGWLRFPVSLIGRQEAIEVGWFSLRLQVTTLSTVVNSQTDKVVVGLVASTATVGQLGIGSQVAEAGRLVAGGALSPIVTRLSVTHGGGDAGFAALFARLHQMWILLVVGGTVIGAAVLYPLIAGWLGAGHGQAAVFGAALVVAYGLNLLTGTPIAYLRAIGQPSLEARFGFVLIALNVGLTVALGVAFGAYGVVGATTVAYLLGTAWFFRAFGVLAPGLGRLPGRLLARALVVAVVAGAAACAWGLAIVAVIPPGPALAGVALGTGAAALAYLVAMTGISPTPTGLRRLVFNDAT